MRRRSWSAVTTPTYFRTLTVGVANLSRKPLNLRMEKAEKAKHEGRAKIKVRKERDYRPHAEFYHAIGVHLAHVKEQQTGFFYSTLSAIVLSAFTVESYLNYVGPLVEPGWDDFDKSSPLAKLRHVASVQKLTLDNSRRPMQTIIQLFKFRNRMAHPRSESILEEFESTEEDYRKYLYTEPRPKWFAFATESNARRCFEDVEQLIEMINASLAKPEISPLSSKGWSGSAGPA